MCHSAMLRLLKIKAIGVPYINIYVYLYPTKIPPSNNFGLLQIYMI